MLASVLVVALCSPGATREPIAVAPFANLNDDASLRWLEQGAAETMAADLKRSGLRVVERAQIAEALAQVAAQSRDDVARAVAAGRIAGASSMLIGSFQKSGAKLRMVARLVDVETGSVSDAAKTTGPVDDVFRLQDELVAALTKRPRPARSGTPSVAAYEKLSLALTAATDDERRALLDQSLALDPTFVYAKDALAALERRLRDSADKSAPAFDARAQQLLALVDDPKLDPPRRTAAAVAALDALDDARRYHALLRAADHVLAAHLPTDVGEDVDERASAARVKALARLVKIDLALQAGERHLAAFPAGRHRNDVDKLVRDLVEERRTEPARKKDYDDELREGAATGDALSRDFHPCIAAKWSKLKDEMLAQCARFLALHGNDKSDDARGHIASARAYLAWADALRGNFAAAQAAARALEADTPGALDDTGLRTAMDAWSTD